MHPRNELEGEREGGAEARPEGLREVAELRVVAGEGRQERRQQAFHLQEAAERVRH